MKFSGTIAEVRRGRDGVTVIVDTEMGQRGVEFDRELLDQVLADFELRQPDDLIGWAVEYDPAHGDLDIIAHGDFEFAADDETPDGEDDHPPDTE